MPFSEPKIPQFVELKLWSTSEIRFSALQRAENSSILFRFARTNRKVSFSALQRAENSSIWRGYGRAPPEDRVSVLFSEPKIPQSAPRSRRRMYQSGFSALQRAENSSIGVGEPEASTQIYVSVLFSEPKIPQ